MKKVAPTPAFSERSKTSGTQSIERAARILREIASYSVHGLRLVDLSKQLDIERPTVHRILNCLIREGLVMQHETSRRYLLGYGLFELGLTAASHFKLWHLCEPSLKRLADETGGIAFMTIRSGVDAISVARAEGRNAINIPSLEIGVHRPLGVGAGSLALLMSLPDDEIERIVFANARRLFGYGKLSVPLMLEIVRASQEVGYAVHDSRLIEGVSGVGIVVHDSHGAPLGAISITALEDHLPVSRQLELLALLRKESRIIQNLVHQSHFDVAQYAHLLAEGELYSIRVLEVESA
ncbi:IclR family transcriptional regulator [Cupriavidus pinatubonensis]|uniref:IclR family transcriptional regulator n=1 Tax=Cupriavidus pinatubonensis TaxID=248026 RepID=UPI00112D3915|nr:IclR family transcriptional regulator [Cupriavidus pinatubonensis]TPQ32959.1 IclR family transcriptional regulator [Cupriavidus pinatubonensis]